MCTIIWQLINQLIIFCVCIELNTYLFSLNHDTKYEIVYGQMVIAQHQKHIHYQQINNQQVTHCKNGNPINLMSSFDQWQNTNRLTDKSL